MPEDDSYSRSACDSSIYDEMEEMRDSILDGLTPIERSALFHDFDDFRVRYIDYKARDLYDE